MFSGLTGFNFDITFVEAHYFENLRAMMKTLLTKSASATATKAVRTVYASKKHQNLPDDEEDYEEMDTYYSSDDEEDESDEKEPKLENLDDLDDDDDYYDDDDDF